MGWEEVEGGKKIVESGEKEVVDIPLRLRKDQLCGV